MYLYTEKPFVRITHMYANGRIIKIGGGNLDRITWTLNWDTMVHVDLACSVPYMLILAISICFIG